MGIKTETIIQILYKRIVGGKLTADECCMLERWIEENPSERRKLTDDLLDTGKLSESYLMRERIDSAHALADMEQRLGLTAAEEPRRKHFFRNLYVWAAAAASVVLIAITGILFFTESSVKKSDVAAVADSTPVPLTIENLTPGTSHAIVTTPSGDTIHINDQSRSTQKIAASQKEGPLQIDVPRGGEFVVVLEDSTKVWLNSESRLIYPTHFASDCRRVEVSGEAYFEVTHNPQLPFIVESGSQRVKVYGTEFNIRAYPEDEAIYTTLSEGSISLTSVGGGGELFLSPGKQAIFNKATTTASVRNIDIERVTSWRHGRFVFEEQSLAQIMRDLSRWYDFEYEFADRDAADKIFMGSIPRYSNFKTAIAILEKSGGLSIDIHDNKVRIASRQ